MNRMRASAFLLSDTVFVQARAETTGSSTGSVSMADSGAAVAYPAFVQGVNENDTLTAGRQGGRRRIRVIVDANDADDIGHPDVLIWNSERYLIDGRGRIPTRRSPHAELFAVREA